jgi:hypothetical protein
MYLIVVDFPDDSGGFCESSSFFDSSHEYALNFFNRVVDEARGKKLACTVNLYQSLYKIETKILK